MTCRKLPDSPRPVFVYGTLTDPERAGAVLDDWRDHGPAVLEGCHRVDGRYPTLTPGGSVAGRLLVTDELDRLDAYEGVADGLYVRVPVPVRDGGTVWVYVGDPHRLDAPADWPGDGPFAERVRDYVASGSAVVRRTGNR